MWITLMSLDVEVSLNADKIDAIECVGDKITVRWQNQTESTYDYVSCVSVEERPRIDYPMIVEDIEGERPELLRYPNPEQVKALRPDVLEVC